ncbi:MAG: hypothetical protein M0036_20195 [Desulfobacteraceae bacterium]|nr:hypothetical protein [Desulfobacteraceae bacterium]
MNINKYPEVKPGRKPLKRIYLAIMLWTVGKAIPVAAKVDPEIKKEFEKLPKNFTLRLMVQPERAFPLFFYTKMLPGFVVKNGMLPYGLQMILHIDAQGKVHYQGADPRGKKFDLSMAFKNLEAAMMIFSFRESTPTGYAHDRFVVEGYLPCATTFMRVLDIVQVYLLPKIIAKRAVKRYPKWFEMPPWRKHINRIIIYLRAFTF